MIKALFGPTTVPSTLRRGLDDAMATHKSIADRVARSLSSSSRTDPAGGAEAAARQEADLAQDMAALADTELRYETEARLLNLAYQGLRTAIRGDKG